MTLMTKMKSRRRNYRTRIRVRIMSMNILRRLMNARRRIQGEAFFVTQCSLAQGLALYLRVYMARRPAPMNLL